MNELDLELFEAYLDEALDSEAQKAFEKRLVDEATFNASFEAYKESTSYLSEKFSDLEERTAFEQTLKTIGNEHFDKKAPTNFKAEIWKYAAAIILMISIGGYFMMNKNHPQYNDFATQPTIALVQRSSGDALVKKAEKAFNSKSFKEATDYLSELLVNDSSNQELLLYRGISQIETGIYGDAYKDLDKVASGASVYKNEALWYKALGYLKQKKYDACKLILVEIPPTADKYTKAQDLLDEF